MASSVLSKGMGVWGAAKLIVTRGFISYFASESVGERELMVPANDRNYRIAAASRNHVITGDRVLSIEAAGA